MGIFESDAVFGCDTEQLSGKQIRLRVWLALQDHVTGNDYVKLLSEFFHRVMAGAAGVAGELYDAAKKAGLEQTALGKTLFLAQKGLQVAMTIANTETAAAAALAPPPIGLGPVAGVPYSYAIRALGYTSAAIIGGTGIAQVVSGGREVGGPVSAGNLYRVNERGPEILSSGGKDYLMMGAQGGEVTSNAAIAATPAAAAPQLVLNLPAGQSPDAFFMINGRAMAKALKAQIRHFEHLN